jgi:predicted dienelactone hydrolase
MRFLTRAVKILAMITLCAIAGPAILLAGLWIDHHQETTLLAPTGQFAVGRITYDWRDSRQQELMAPHAGIPREIFAWIWYPASTQKSSPPADYLPRSWQDAWNRQRGWFLTEFLWRKLSRVHAHSAEAPALSGAHQKYPVILMRAGLAVDTVEYTSLAEDLASHGYVVVGFDAPYRSTVVVFADGRVIARTPQNNADLLSGIAQRRLANRLVQAWSADMSFALDRLEKLNADDPTGRFAGRLDLNKLGAFGHSLGGATALQFCHDDPRCKAGVDIDGAPLGSALADGVKQPFLFLLSDHSREPKAETAPIEANIQSIYDRLPENQRLWIVLRGSEHFGFMDLTPLPVQIAHLFHIVPLSGRRQITITRDCLRTFFDVYLKGDPLSSLQHLSKYRQVEYSH